VQYGAECNSLAYNRDSSVGGNVDVGAGGVGIARAGAGGGLIALVIHLNFGRGGSGGGTGGRAMNLDGGVRAGGLDVYTAWWATRDGGGSRGWAGASGGAGSDLGRELDGRIGAGDSRLTGASGGGTAEYGGERDHQETP
jgi:hypothetical protein